MKVTHEQIVSGKTTAGVLAVILSRVILWWQARTVKGRWVPVVEIDGERDNAWDCGWFPTRHLAEKAGKAEAKRIGGHYCGTYNALSI